MIVRVVSFEEVATKLGVSKQTLRRQWRKGNFPEPVRLSPRRLVWPVDQLNAFLAGQATAAEADKEISV